jgi:non-ribosomal peptide synthetase component E (peptide arylation enzyme)
MDSERIFSADQIVVHPDLAKIIREYTKAVVRANPDDIPAFSVSYFRDQMDKDIAKYKLPERLETLPEFPVSTFGKVSKKALGEMIAKKLEQEAKS